MVGVVQRPFMHLRGRARLDSAARVLVTLIALAVAGPAAGLAEIQEVSGDLLVEISAIRAEMPGRSSEGFVPPSGAEIVCWRRVVEALFNEDIDVADSLLVADFPEYLILRFTDTGFDSLEYYLVREVFPVTLGWGTFILRICHEREIAVEVPHPLYDINTPTEGADIFRRVGARFFIMAGTHRCANQAHSLCDGASDVCGDGVYHESDMGHVTESMYEQAHEVFTERCPEGYAFSIHGTVRTYCEDVFLSNGHETDSKQVLYDLRAHMLAAGGITVGIAGDGISSCPLFGSTNVQGRFTNGSPDPCTEPVSSTTGFFIHAEQQRRVRDNLSVYGKLIDAIEAVIPAVCASVPEADGTPARESLGGLGLSPASENPCVGSAAFALSVSEACHISVEVYTPLGRRVAVLHDGAVTPGTPLTVTFDGHNLPSGLYFVRASSGRESATRAVTILK